MGFAAAAGVRYMVLQCNPLPAAADGTAVYCNRTPPPPEGSRVGERVEGTAYEVYPSSKHLAIKLTLLCPAKGVKITIDFGGGGGGRARAWRDFMRYKLSGA